MVIVVVVTSQEIIPDANCGIEGRAVESETIDVADCEQLFVVSNIVSEYVSAIETSKVVPVSPTSSSFPINQVYT